MIPKTNLSIAIDYARRQIIHTGIEREIVSWHSIKGDYKMREAFGVSFKAPIPDEIDILQNMVRPNLPWAEDHFQERVCGEPLNPGEQYKRWPFYKMDGNVRRIPCGDGPQFSHTYMERYWPKHANNNFLMTGIRFDYGDLADVVNLLANDPHTRQAYLPVWFPEDTGAVHGERVPCSLGYLFELVKGYLHITYYIRSCDYLRHFRDDIYLTCRLGHWVLNSLRTKNEVWMSFGMGFLTMHIANLHIFSHESKFLFHEEAQSTGTLFSNQSADLT